MKFQAAMQTCALMGILALSGCGSDDGGTSLTVSGGTPDPAKTIAQENAKGPAPKNDPNFQKTSDSGKANRAREAGVSSGGGTSSAVLE